MWFRFPEGTREISVQLQNFFPEAKDEDGRDCFRAPDHFAPIILDLPGFGQGKPIGNPKDLPKDDLIKDTALSQLAGQVEGLKVENEALKGAMAATKMEIDEWKLKFFNLEAEFKNLQADQAEEKGKK
jgi:hypothetical protein